jgi:hypothetical protein
MDLNTAIVEVERTRVCLSSALIATFETPVVPASPPRKPDRMNEP